MRPLEVVGNILLFTLANAFLIFFILIVSKVMLTLAKEPPRGRGIKK